MTEQTIIPTKVKMTTKDPEEMNSQELIEFYEKMKKIKLELEVKETPDDLIDLEFYAEIDGVEQMVDKIGIPYADMMKIENA